LVHVTVCGLIPTVLLSKLKPCRFLNLDDVSACIDIESIIAIAIGCGLLKLRAAFRKQVDTNAAHTFLAGILNRVLILVLPNAVAE
jgi:hypothetical protein